jgi:hypothetical protein
MFVLRIGHAERETVVDELTEHHVHGRLDVEELDRRQRAALEATTQAELSALTADLPTPDAAARMHERQTKGGRTPWRWLMPPAAVAGAAAWFANLHTNAGETLATGLVCGGIGYAGHWWASRRR